MLTPEERKQKVIESIDPDLFVEVMELSTADLVDAFSVELEENWQYFQYLEDEIEDYGPDLIEA